MTSPRISRHPFARRVIAAAVGLCAAVALSPAPNAAGATAAPTGPVATRPGPNGAASIAVPAVAQGGRQIAPGGRGSLTYAGKVDVSALPDITATEALTKRSNRAALTVPGWFTGSKVGTTQAKTARVAGPLVTTPTVIRLNKAGTRGSQSSCGCQPPDTNGAISSTNIVEAVNLSLTVYKRGGALVKRTSLASFFPTARGISDPHIIFDNKAKRWVLVFIPIPENTSTTPQMYVAVSTSANPTGTWFKYTLSFSGGLFPAGTLLDYPMVGQDSLAVLIGSNNFQLDGFGNFNYINSTVFALPKSVIFAGGGLSFPAFGTAFSTHPSIARGKPIHAYPRSYLLATNSSGGYNLYYFTNTGGTPTYTLQGTTVNSLWSPPPGAQQPAPNGAVVLDALDGRVQAPPIQTDSFLWFTHAVALGSFPGVRYGAISLASSGTGGVSATTENAYESGTSYDWNPSLTLAEPASNSVRIFLNWAATDPANGQNVSLRVSGVGPGEGVPSLAGIGTTVFTGGGSPSQTRFGDYSSASMDVINVSASCTFNTQALVVNQVFNGGDWQVRLARVGTC